MKARYTLLLICGAALALRLALLIFVEHPGIADPNHYYNLGQRLVGGHGFTIDYIWHYVTIPEQRVHPDDYWMPLTAVLAALPMLLFGPDVQAALLPFVLIGAVGLPLISYAAARQLGTTTSGALFAAASAAFLPELVVYSLRTDTVMPNSLWVGLSLLLLVAGLRRGRWQAFALAGVFVGLAYLTRSENLLLFAALLPVLLVYALWGERRPTLKYAALLPLTALLTVSPWLLRNLSETSALTTPGLTRALFMTDVRDLYAYGRDLTLTTMLAAQTPGQIVSKRVFELAANVKLLYTTLDLFLPVAVAGGLVLLIAARDRARLLTLSPVLILVAAMGLFYALLAPYLSQGGSFKRFYVSLIPLLLPLAAYALERAIASPRIRRGAMILVVGFLVANAVERARADITFTNGYLERNRQMAAVAQTLPDINGDGVLVLMAQDPFMVRFVGLPSVMFPLADRDTTLAAATRYNVDYLLLPPDRPALDSLYSGDEVDERVRRVAEVPGAEYVFYALSPAGEADDA